jgi:hypothetical protein
MKKKGKEQNRQEVTLLFNSVYSILKEKETVGIIQHDKNV